MLIGWKLKNISSTVVYVNNQVLPCFPCLNKASQQIEEPCLLLIKTLQDAPTVITDLFLNIQNIGLRMHQIKTWISGQQWVKT